MRYRARLSKLNWTEIWELGERSPLAIVAAAPFKLLGITWLDRTIDIDLETVPVERDQIPPRFRPLAEKAVREIARLGFEFDFADFPLGPERGCTLYFRNGEVIGQQVCRRKPEWIAFGTLLASGEFLVTAPRTSGIDSGGVTSLLVVRDATPERVLEVHRSRYSDDAVIPSRAELIRRLDEMSRKMLDYNVERGVYVPLD